MPDPVSLIDSLPRPQVVREHLAENLRENRLLRSLLRLSEKAVEATAPSTVNSENRGDSGEAERPGVVAR